MDSDKKIKQQSDSENKSANKNTLSVTTQKSDRGIGMNPNKMIMSPGLGEKWGDDKPDGVELQSPSDIRSGALMDLLDRYDGRKIDGEPLGPKLSLQPQRSADVDLGELKVRRKWTEETFSVKLPEGRDIHIYIAKRPWEDAVLGNGFKCIVDYLLSRSDLSYVLHIESAHKEHFAIKPHIGNNKLVLVDDTFIDETLIDYAFSIGGDGTLLWAHRMFKLKLPPFLCFTGGTLCFLSTFEIDKAEMIIEWFHKKLLNQADFRIKPFPRLTSYVCTALNSCNKERRYVLNDVVIERKNQYTIEVDLYINNVFAVKSRSDGIIISSSTGSTAYNLSLHHGFIVHSDVECMIINPRSSMSLSSRPIVVPPGAEVKIMVSQTSRNPCHLIYDGLDVLPFDKGDYIVIETSPLPVNMIIRDDYNEFSEWIHKLRELRGWN